MTACMPMPTSRQRRRLLAAIPLGLALAAGERAQAQPSVSAISIRETRDVAYVRATAPIGPIAGLTRFNFGYHNGDHKFRRLRLVAAGAFGGVGFSDQNGDDPFLAEAEWINFPRGLAGEVYAVGHGRSLTALTLDEPPPNHAFVLRGFDFMRAAGTDANIREIMIQHREDSNRLEVHLSDDEGADFRNLAEDVLKRLFVAAIAPMALPVAGAIAGTLLGAAGAAAPLLGMVGSDVLTPDALAKLFAAERRGRPYAVSVQYAWVPREYLDLSPGGTVNWRVLGGRHPSRRTGTPVPAGRSAVLRGFGFRFENSDHHLLTIRARLDDGGLGVFQDNNEEDPMSWWLDYALLR